MDKEGSKKSGEQPKNPMTKEAAARIQRSEANEHGGGVEKGGFAARAQRAADKNEKEQDKEGSKKSGEQPKNPMTKEAAARIQRSEAKEHGGGVEKGGFAARAQRAADKNEKEQN